MDIIPKPQATKDNVDKLDFIKIRSFCASTNTIERAKREPTEQEKIFARPLSNKRLMSKIFRKFL